MNRARWAAAFAALVMLLPTAASAAPKVPTDDSVPLTCQQYMVDATGLLAVDLVTGHTRRLTEAEGLTAAGYNSADDLVYVWDSKNGGIGALGAGTYGFRGAVPGLAAQEWDGGEIDQSGVFWLLSSGTGAWAGIDLETFDVVASGSSELGAGDWAARSETYGALFTVDDERLLGFSTAGQVLSEIAESDGLGGQLTATWADATQYLYLLVDDSTVVRTEPEDTRMIPFSTLKATAPTDAAWCPGSILMADWGDAPDSYKTSLASKGPRHSIVNFELSGETAPLMLGTMVTPEPNPAYGDNDDDDAVVSSLLVSATDPLVVDLLATNNTDDDALMTVWLDAGATGSFTKEPNASVIVPANSGTLTYQVELPAPQTETWMRMRLAPGKGATTPTGAIRGGEVEDWLVYGGTAAPGLKISGATFDEVENSLSLTVENTGNAAQSPAVEARGLCTLMEGDVRLAAGTEANLSCTFDPPPGGTAVAITAVDGDVAAPPVVLIWGTPADASETEAPQASIEEAPQEAPQPFPWLPAAIVIGGIALLAAGVIAARRASKSDEADESHEPENRL